MAIEVTQASAAEIDVVAALHAASFTESWDEPWSPEFLSRILSAPGTFAFVAQDTASNPGTPVGFALVRLTVEECEVQSIGVTLGARRRGIGGALLDAVGRHAAGLGATSLVLEVAEDNAPAISLYVSRGFVAVGRREHYYRRAGNNVGALILRGEVAGMPKVKPSE